MNRSVWTVCLALGVMVVLNGCVDRAPEIPTQPPAVPSLTATFTELSPATAMPTSRPLPPTNTPRPTRTPIPTPDLFTCLPVEPSPPVALEPLRLLYVNEDEVWLWDEASDGQSRVELPADAAAPHLSPDGRYVAFFEKEQTFSHPAAVLDGIPLALLDRQTGRVDQIGTFSTLQAHRRYPESNRVYLELEWLHPVGDPQQALELVVAVAAEPWAIDLSAGNGYISQRYRVDLASAQVVALTQSEYERRYFPAFSTSGGSVLSLSPDGRFEIRDHHEGVVVIDRITNRQTPVALPPACPEEGCYLTGSRWFHWLPDSSAFLTSAAKSAHFDERAETSLFRVRVDPQVGLEAETIVRANPLSFVFSPDSRFLSYLNQPDIDTAPSSLYNWVTLWLMDIEEMQPRQYTSAWLLRLASWNPDGQRFLLTYSPHGGANPVMARLAVGSICQPPVELQVAERQTIQHATWLDTERFLLWMAPSSGIPNRYESGLYFYNLKTGSAPVRIAGVIQDYDKPYGTRQEVVVLRREP